MKCGENNRIVELKFDCGDEQIPTFEESVVAWKSPFLIFQIYKIKWL